MRSHPLSAAPRPTSLTLALLLPLALAGCGDSGMDTDSSTATGVTQPTSPTTTTMTGTTVGTESSTDSDAGTETSQGSTDTQATTDSTTAGTETTPVTDSDSDSDSDPTDATDTGGCPLKCSADLTAVVDCNNEIIDPCDGDEGCDAETLQCTSPCGAAEQSGSSVGCEYYATLMHTFEENPCFAAFVANTWDSPAHISVEYDGAPLDVGAFTYLPDGAGPNLVYDPYDDVGGLPPGQVAILLLAGPDGMDVCPYPTAMPVGPSVLGTGTGASFRITTDVPVVAYQINPYGGGSAAVTGASLLLPTSVWDDNYVVVNAYSYFAPRVPSFNVVAREDNTQVTLQPVVDVIGGGGLPSGGAGQSLMFSLDAGEHAQFSQIEELTGSIIKADKPVGLMGGHECMRVPSGEMWCDHGEQMIPPVRALGNEYVGVMHRPRNGEDSFWRIVGAVDGTQLTWSNNVGGPATLSQGQLVEFITGTPFVVSSQDEDHPFLLFNIMSGNGWVPGPEGYGDPDFVISYPPEQYGNYYVFFADPTYPETNLVVVRSRDMGGFHDVNLDCAGPLNGWQAVGQDYEWTRIDLITGDFEDVGNCSTGPHIMESDGRFGVWVWGWGTPETTIKTTNVSYGYPGGMNVKLINDLVLIPE